MFDKYLVGGIPDEINIIATTGKEENQAFYTRTNNIMVPVVCDLETEEWAKVYPHEMFHIFSRYNAGIREKLYNALGFMKLPKAIPFPTPFAPKKITNPDSPVPEIDYGIKLKYNGTECWWYVITLTFAPGYMGGGQLFDYMTMIFLKIGEGATLNTDFYDPAKPVLVE
jgi:hypothetical protein